MATSYTYDEMVAQLRDINQNMNKLQLKYDRDTENLAPEKISESYSSIWESNFQPMYQDYADGYLILKNICKEIFDKGGCEVGEIWHDKYDGRGAAFREEFSQEVIKTAKDEYIRIKRQLGHKLDF